MHKTEEGERERLRQWICCGPCQEFAKLDLIVGQVFVAEPHIQILNQQTHSAGVEHLYLTPLQVAPLTSATPVSSFPGTHKI